MSGRLLTLVCVGDDDLQADGVLVPVTDAEKLRRRERLLRVLGVILRHKHLTVTEVYRVKHHVSLAARYVILRHKHLTVTEVYRVKHHVSLAARYVILRHKHLTVTEVYPVKHHV